MTWLRRRALTWLAREQSYRPAIAILTACPNCGRNRKEEAAEILFIKPTNTPELLEWIETVLADKGSPAVAGKFQRKA
jgi:hypothetical protein